MTGSYRLGVVERTLAAGQLERVHSLLHVLDRSDDRASADALIRILSGSLPEFVLEELQNL